MDYTTHFNSALNGRCYFLVIVGQDCKMRWSQNTSVQNQEIVWLKVGTLRSEGRDSGSINFLRMVGSGQQIATSYLLAMTNPISLRAACLLAMTTIIAIFMSLNYEVATSISIGRSPMDHTSHSNSALKGRNHFLLIVGQDCKIRWSKNVKTHHREMVWW